MLMRINKNQNTNSKKAKILTVSVIAAALLLGAAAYALVSPSSPFYLGQKNEEKPENTVDYSKPTDDQKQAGNDAKNQFNEDKYPDAEQNPEASKGDSVVSITSAQQNGEVLSVRAIINGADSTGRCVLNMSLGDKVVSKTVETQSMGSYYACKGFDVPKAELETGEWTFTVNYSDANGSSESTRQKVTIS